MPEQFDYSDFKEAPAALGDNVLAQLSGMATDQKQYEATIARLEVELKEAKESLRHISENQLPQLMEDIGLEEFKTIDGSIKISLNEVIRGSIPAKNETEAFKWLDANDNGNLIKRTFQIEFGKDEEKWADKFERDLKQRKKPLHCKRKKKVHPQTLQAFVRTQLAEGEPIPMDLFGVYRQRVAKVELSS